MSAFDVELHVDELVLEGVHPAEREAVAEGMRAELARLIAAGGVSSALLAGGGALRLDGGSLRVEPGLAGAALGARIAQAVHAGMGGGERAGVAGGEHTEAGA